MPTTRSPRWRSRSATCIPRKPAAPVTRTLIASALAQTKSNTIMAAPGDQIEPRPARPGQGAEIGPFSNINGPRKGRDNRPDGRFGRSRHGADSAFGVRRLGRQIHRTWGPGLPQRHAGPDAADHHAAPARPCRRAEYRGLCHRLSRLAPGRARPGDGRGQVAPRPASHQVPAGRERGSCRDRLVGHPAAGPVRRRQIRRRVRDVVRQRPRRRPLRRRIPPRQPRWHRQAWRHSGAGGRRSHLQILHDRAPDRICLHGLRHSGPQSREHPGVPGLRPRRLGGLALFRLLDRDEGGGRQLRFHRLGLSSIRHGSRSRSRTISSCPKAGSTSARPRRRSSRPRRWSRSCCSTSTSSTPRSPSPAPTSSTR